jgi:hypothetical protein
LSCRPGGTQLRWTDALAPPRPRRRTSRRRAPPGPRAGHASAQARSRGVAYPAGGTTLWP